MSKAQLRADAINRFVVDAKAQGVYDALKASCVMAGWDSLAGALTPLAGTAPTNNGFLAADYDRGTGLKGDGTSYLKSNRLNNADPLNDRHYSVYLTSCNASNLQAVFGSAQFAFPNTANYLIINVDSASLYNVSGYLAADRLPFTPFNSLLPTFAGATRSSSTGFSARAGGTTASTVSASVRTIALNEYVFARNNNGSVEFRSEASIAFYSIGSSLGPDPATGLAALDTLVSRLLADFRSIDEDGMDRDALAYIRNVEAADGGYLELGVKRAIDTFVRGCKYDGIWDAIKASCILCGARTLAGALVPLAGAAPSNNNFVDADYNRETGLKGDGSTKYLDSGRAGTADDQNDRHRALYATTKPSSASKAYMGHSNGSSAFDDLFHAGVVSYIRPCTSGGAANGVSATGFMGYSRASGTAYDWIIFASASTGATAASVSPQSSNALVFASNETAGAVRHSDSRLAFYSIGESISDLALLDTRVTALVQGVQLGLQGGLDDDVAAFRTATGAQDVVGLNRLVVYLKEQSLWDYARFYPMKSSQNAGSGSTVYGLGGLTSNNMTLVNSPTWGSGGVTFDGSTQYGTATDFLSDATLSAWISLSTTDASVAVLIAQFHPIDPALRSFQVYSDNTALRVQRHSGGSFEVFGGGNTTSERTTYSYESVDGGGRSLWVNKSAASLSLLGGVVVSGKADVSTGITVMSQEGGVAPLEGTVAVAGFIETALTTTQRETITDLINAL